MPLLGKKIYSPSKPPKDILPNEKVFTIPFTGERFRSKSEYDKRCSLYREKIWTCQCTGHVNLSYEEAHKSEKAGHKTIKDQFDECFERPTLEVVHHATVSLDNLVDQAWTKIQQVLLVGENVALKVKAAGRTIKGTIVSVDNCGMDVNPTSNCSSPSSDKENNNSKDQPKKWQAPKLLPYKYSMRLEGEEKVINAIPASDLARCGRPPSKDLIRLFIRAHTVRAGQSATSPWVVDDKMVHKYKLPKKFTDFLLSPAKMTRITPQMVEEISKKRKMEVEVVESSSDEDEIVLSEVIRKSIGKSDASANNDSDSDVPLVKLKSKNNSNGSDSEDEPLSKLGSGKKSPKKKSPTKSKDSKKKDVKKKKLKQMTLFEIANKKGSKSSNKNSPRKLFASTVNVTPPIVRQMVKAHKANKEHAFQELLKKAVQMLNSTQRNNLPSQIKEEFMKKYEIFREKKLLAKMTPEEKDNYFKRKRKLREQESKKKFEDQQLKQTPLPQPKLVSCPESIPNEVFGDVAMVTEFISCFKGLLMPNDEYPIYSDALMKALCNGVVGYSYLNRVLDILLQTLLQDRIAEGYEELKTKLNNIAINSYTASELVRLCLRSNDSGQELDDENDDEEEDFVDVPQNIIEKLEDKEFYQLEPTDKLAILKGLCLRIMGSYSVQEYMEGKQTQANKLMKQKWVGQKELNEQLKQQDEEEDKDKPKDDADKVDSDAPATPAESIKAENEDDIISSVRNRRVSAAKSAAEKAKKEKQRRKEFEKSMIEQKKQRQLKTMQEAIEAARQVLRFVPIGFDRHHNRYWMFSKTTPGLYIEKGWFTQDYNHCVKLEGDNTDEDDKPIAKLCTPTKQNGTASPKKSPRKSPKKACNNDPSIPHYSQNLWYEYDTSKDLDELISSLHRQGIRESELKKEIKKRYDDISKAIYRSRRSNLELRESNGDSETLQGIRKELLDLEVRLRSGGLGGVPDFKTFEKKVETSSELKDFGALLLEVEGHVLEKFIKYFMKNKQQLGPTPSANTVKQDNSDDDYDDDEVVIIETDGTKRPITHKHRQRWRDAVENCATFSRFHVLMGMLEYCVNWDKSVEAAKCKICRKKGNDDRLLLCDDCNLAFHMYCLRPALTDVPEGEWFCAACVHKRKPIQFYPARGKSEFEVIEEEKPIIIHELTCTICGGDEDLINCSECPMSYHTFCHEPQFRYPPRGNWQCMKCKGSKKRRRGPVYYSDDDEDYVHYPKPKRKRGPYKKKVVIEADDSPPRTSRRAPSELSICEDILNELVKNKDSWPFAEAVNKRAVPDYHTIIKHPMDFRTMKNKFLLYSSAQEFVDDLALVFRNSALYNKEDSDIYQCMLNMEKHARKLVSSRLPNHIYSRDVVANGYNDHGNSSKRSRRR
ncbi:hypothetical protein LOTGIDRAFT_228371 [Lottia gigantea]|uniref:Tyrosine-protein kinase BAZ1B n=1 Tax=Lottia gigantea TaxID=225164 RepID=V4AVF4_LOTGI|nr:hypothetical protein LOTGIDRAFT_228371 [Lottia gigantea]ESO97816.1 hypothetical protein LOTGIDRAFT_228371 [Lottia gigantea]